jgi:hypothetical protein
MNWAVDRGVIATSPLAGMKLPVKEVARERVLSNRELYAVDFHPELSRLGA